MEIRPLKSREVAEFLPMFLILAGKMKQQTNKTVGAKIEDIKFTLDNAEDINVVIAAQEKAGSILPNAVRNLSGIEDEWSTICEQMYYLPFVMDVLVRLVAISSVTGEDSKNSGRPSGQ
jgi:hypothetical protein